MSAWTELGRLSLLLDYRATSRQQAVSRAHLNVLWLRLLRPMALMLLSVLFTAPGDPVRKETGREPGTYWLATSVSSLRIRLISESPGEESGDGEAFLTNLYFGQGAPLSFIGMCITAFLQDFSPSIGLSNLSRGEKSGVLGGGFQ